MATPNQRSARVTHVTASDKPTYGRSAHAAVQRSTFHAFPEIGLHIDPYLVQFGDGDWMTVVRKITGTFSGEMVLPGGEPIQGSGKLKLTGGYRSMGRPHAMTTMKAMRYDRYGGP